MENYIMNKHFNGHITQYQWQKMNYVIISITSVECDFCHTNLTSCADVNLK